MAFSGWQKNVDFIAEGYIGKRSPGYPLLILFAFGQYKLVAIYQFVLGIFNSLLWYKILLNLKFSRKFSFFTVLVMQVLSM